MDPDKNLTEQLDLARSLAAAYLVSAELSPLAAAADLAIRVQALDEWLSKGGALPERWGSRSKPPAESAVVAAIVDHGDKCAKALEALGWTLKKTLYESQFDPLTGQRRK